MSDPPDSPRGPPETLRPLDDAIALLLTRRFGVFWIACLLSNIGTWAQQVAQPWLLLSLGASPFILGLDSFAMNGPVWLLTLIGGFLADRGDRRRIIAGFQSLQMLCPILIVVLVVLGLVEPWMIVLLSLVVGVTDALSMPSFQSIVPTIVDRDRIGAALSLNSTQFNLSRILGPVIAGVLLSTLGAAWCFALNAASYVPFILVAFWILPRAGGAPAEPAAEVEVGFVDGLRIVSVDKLLRASLLTTLATSLLCAPLITFCPILIKDGFSGGAAEFSIALSAFGLGGIAGAIGLLLTPASLDRRKIATRFALGYGAVLILSALNPRLALVPVLLAIAGVAMNISNTAANTILQATAPVHVLGRAVSLHMMAIRGGVSIGNLLTGLVITHLDIRSSLLINGVLAIAAHIAIRLTWPKQD